MTNEELRNKLDEAAQSYGFTDFDKWNNYENLSTNTVIPCLLKLLESMCEKPEVRGEIEETKELRRIPELKKPMKEPPKIPWHILSEEKPTRSGTFLIMDCYGGMSEASFNLPDATWFQYRWNCQNYNVVKWVSFDELRGDDE